MLDAFFVEKYAAGMIRKSSSHSCPTFHARKSNVCRIPRRRPLR
ncbi:hypothetical protein PF003_g20516 [Phytophthora fragariae]|nr:hypothetical protein PF003_g20516 [Phytophthora fragariae]